MIEVIDLPRKKVTAPEWISIKEAAAIISRNSEHEVTPAYLRNLASKGELDTKEIDARTKFYNRAQVEALRVKQYKKGE